jgi:hypothetical protein
MSWELANEKWLDGDESGLLGQFASGRGYTDLIDAVDAGDYPALAKFFKDGASEQVSQMRAELKRFSAKTGKDLRDTATALRDLMDDQKFVMVTDGTS